MGRFGQKIMLGRKKSNFKDCELGRSLVDLKTKKRPRSVAKIGVAGYGEVRELAWDRSQKAI